VVKVEANKEVMEKLFEIYKYAMDIAIDLTNGTYSEEAIRDIALDIADEVERVMNLLTVKLPEDMKRKMEELNEEYEKAVKQWTR
jgi:ATP-dependent Clp protease ATP-binding subunit ClpA